jgi:hypothetical protein
MVKTDQTNDAILRMVGLYRVVTRAAVSTLLPEGTEPDKRLGKLVKDGLLRSHKGLAGNRSIYQLTKKGAGMVSVSPARGRIIGAQSLLKNLGVLLFCHAENCERHRVEAEDLGKALDIELPDGAYCLCRVKERTVVFECYVPAPHTPIETIIWHLKKRLMAARKCPGLVEAIKELRFGFALIVPNSHRRKAIMDAVRTCGAGERLPLIKRARIWVEVVDELDALFGTAAPSLGRTSGGAAKTLLWDGGK